MKKVAFWFWLLLSACVSLEPQPLTSPPPTLPTANGPTAEVLRIAAEKLPGAEVAAGSPLTLLYPGDALFSQGAALPLAGGVDVLDPLAVWLRGDADGRWLGTVRAVTGISAEYDRQLAEKRAELLGRYFRNRGISTEQLSLRAEAGAGASLELTRQE